MTIQKESLFGTVVTQGPTKRLVPAPDGTKAAKFAAAGGAPEYAVGTPLAFDSSVGMWKVWSANENAVYTITANATPGTGGTFILTFNGETTATIAFDATAAIVQAAIEALGSVDVGSVTCVQTTGTDLGDANAVVTITFGGNLKGVDVNGTADMTGITGNDHVFAQVTEGGGAATSTIGAFVYPEAIQTSATLEVLGTILIMGVVHRDDVVVPAGESQGGLDAALKDPSLREKGIIVQGLAGVS